MIGRIVEIETDGVHLSVDRGFLTVSQDRNKLGQVALDDISALIVHGHGSTFSANLINRLAERGTPMVMCGANHSPTALVWPIAGHHEQGHRMQAQADAGKPLRKRLWKDIVKAKINAQAWALHQRGERSGGLEAMAKKVRSGDPDNLEAQAAKRYWPSLMGPGFLRNRTAEGANSFLNYGYMILRAATARSILGAGLHPSLSIHHQSRGTALRLADDLMEPFRPYLDVQVCGLMDVAAVSLDKETKAILASITTLDLQGPLGASPLQVCMDRLATSLAQVYLGERDHLEFPAPPLSLDMASRRP